MNQQINFRLIYTPAVMFWEGCVLNYMKMRSVTKALSTDFASYSAKWGLRILCFVFKVYLHWISRLRIIYIHQVCELSVYILHNWKTVEVSVFSLISLTFVLNSFFSFWNKVNRARRISRYASLLLYWITPCMPGWDIYIKQYIFHICNVLYTTFF